MGTVEKNRDYAEKLKRLVLAIYQKKYTGLLGLCSSDMIWKVNYVRGNIRQYIKLCEILAGRFLEKNLENLVFRDTQVMILADGVALVNAYFDVIYCEADDSEGKNVYEIFGAFQSDKIVYVQVNSTEKTGKIHKIRSTNEEYYLIQEDEVLYIESNHNHVIWHWLHGIIESNDSLRHLQEVLSEDFVRIQRGYLVNRNHVRCVRRCEAVIRNGDVLSIPSRKYVKVKKKIIRNQFITKE